MVIYEKIKLINLIFIIIFVITFAIIGGESKGKDIMTQKPIENVLKEHTQGLMSLPGVVGTAQSLCNDKPCIKIYVIEKTSELEKKIPNILEGYPVFIEEVGEIRALP